MSPRHSGQAFLAGDHFLPRVIGIGPPALPSFTFSQASEPSPLSSPHHERVIASSGIMAIFGVFFFLGVLTSPPLPSILPFPSPPSCKVPFAPLPPFHPPSVFPLFLNNPLQDECRNSSSWDFIESTSPHFQLRPRGFGYFPPPLFLDEEYGFLWKVLSFLSRLPNSLLGIFQIPSPSMKTIASFHEM